MSDYVNKNTPRPVFAPARTGPQPGQDPQRAAGVYDDTGKFVPSSAPAGEYNNDIGTYRPGDPVPGHAPAVSQLRPDHNVAVASALEALKAALRNIGISC